MTIEQASVHIGMKLAWGQAAHEQFVLQLLNPFADSEIVMVDGTFCDDSFEHRSWDGSGTTISGI